MAEDLQNLISSAATPDDVGQEPVAAGGAAAPQDAVPTAPQVQGGNDDTAFVQELYGLLRGNPALANRVADVIEEFFSGGEKGRTMPMGTAPATPGPGPGPGPGGLPPELVSLVQALDGRLANLEKSQADMALERELAETRQEYEKLKDNFPILPDLSDKEILQIALQYNGLPLREALYLWAMRKLQEGEGPVVDKLVASRIEQSKGTQAPRVETKGGGVPAGTQEPPANFREARRRAKEFLAAIAGGPVA